MGSRQLQVRLLLIGLTLAALGGSGYLVYKLFAPSERAEGLVPLAQQAYDEGLRALNGGDLDKAIKQLDEARLYASKALDQIEAERKQPRGESPEVKEKLQTLEGQALWVKARALRDSAYAVKAKEGQPIELTLDSTTQEQFRTFWRIPDDEPRREAFACMEKAAEILTKDKEVQRETLRTLIMVPNARPAMLITVANQVLALDDTEPRARYFLGRMEFEQPNTSTGQVIPFERRDLDRMQRARDHVSKLERSGRAPLWRTLALKAQLLYWYSTIPAKYADAEKDAAELRELLFNPTTGAMARAAKGEGFNGMGSFDLDGIRSLTQLATFLASEPIRKDPKANPALLMSTCNAAIAIAGNMVTNVQAGNRRGEFLEDAVLTVNRAARSLGDTVPTGWDNVVASLEKVAKRYAEAKVSRPIAYSELANIWLIESRRLAKVLPAEELEKIDKKPAFWVAEGMKVAKEAQETADNMVPLHVLSVQIRMKNQSREQEFEADLAALQAGTTPVAKAQYNLARGMLAVRQGKFDRARQYLEEVLQVPDAQEFHLRAHMMLADVYLVTDKPSSASNSLKELEKAYERYEQLSPLDRSIAEEFLPGPAQVASRLVTCQLMLARQRIARFRRENPKQPVPFEIVKGYEDIALRYLKKLSVPSRPDEQARLALCRYYLDTRRVQDAEDAIKTLRREYPDSLDALKLQVGLVFLPRTEPAPKLSKDDQLDLRNKADQLIQGFVKEYPSNSAGHLFWVEWLMGTNRASEALTYLRDPLNFRNQKAEDYRRILALALLASGERDEGRQILQQLPRDPQIDALLIQSLGTSLDQRKQIRDAITRHENNGQFRCWDAAFKLSEGKFEEAARDAFAAREFSRFQSAAQELLRRSLFGLAAANPAKARELILEMSKTAPDEHVLYLSAALAALYLDDLGTERDNWERTQSMSAALRRWEDAAKKARIQDAPRTITRARFWMMAGRSDLAWPEAKRAIEQPGDKIANLMFLIEVALENREPEQLRQAAEVLKDLKAIVPDSGQVKLMEIELLRADEKVAEAIKVTEEYLTKFPKALGFYNVLFNLHKIENDPKKLQEVIDRWKKLAPDDLNVELNAIYTTIIAGNKEAAAKMADAFFEKQMLAVEKQLDRGKPADASPEDAKDWEKVRQKRLRDSRFRIELSLAEICYKARAFDLSENWVAKAGATLPEDQTVMMLKGQIAVERKDWEQARSWFTKVIEKDRNQSVAKNNLAYILAKHLNQPKKALELVEQARLSRHTNTPFPIERLRREFLDTIGTVYLAAAKEIGEKRFYTQMRDIFEKASKRYPSDPRFLLYAAEAARGLEEAERWRSLFEAARRLATETRQLNAEEKQEVIRAATAALMGS